jgi:hypothetical protein
MAQRKERHADRDQAVTFETECIDKSNTQTGLVQNMGCLFFDRNDLHIILFFVRVCL